MADAADRVEEFACGHPRCLSGLVKRSRGLMDKALALGTKDCRLESCQDHGYIVLFLSPAASWLAAFCLFADCLQLCSSIVCHRCNVCGRSSRRERNRAGGDQPERLDAAMRSPRSCACTCALCACTPGPGHGLKVTCQWESGCPPPCLLGMRRHLGRCRRPRRGVCLWSPTLSLSLGQEVLWPNG